MPGRRRNVVRKISCLATAATTAARSRARSSGPAIERTHALWRDGPSGSATHSCCCCGDSRKPAELCCCITSPPDAGVRAFAVTGWHDAMLDRADFRAYGTLGQRFRRPRSEEHTSELQSHSDLVCRLLLETITQITKVVQLLTEN